MDDALTVDSRRRAERSLMDAAERAQGMVLMNDQAEEATLDSVFSNDEEVETVTDEKPEPEVEPEPETPEKDEPPSGSGNQQVPLAGLLDEREKRKAAEARLQKLESELAAKEPEKRVSVFDDEEKAFESLRNEFQTGRTQDRFDLSREMMSLIKDDFPEREQQFLEMAQGDASLVQQLRTAKNPAKFAYDYVIKQEKAKKLEGIDDIDAKLARLEELEAKFAEIEKADEADERDAQKRKSLTPSLAKQRSAGGDGAVIEESLDDIFKG